MRVTGSHIVSIRLLQVKKKIAHAQVINNVIIYNECRLGR